MNRDHPVIDIGLHASENKGCGCLGLLIALGILGAAVTHIVSAAPETQNKQVAIQSEVLEESPSLENATQSADGQIEGAQDKSAQGEDGQRKSTQGEDAQPNRWSSGIEQVKKQTERLEPYSQQIREQGERLKAQSEKLEPHTRQIRAQAENLQTRAGNVGNTIRERLLSINGQTTGEQTPSGQLTLQASCGSPASEAETWHTVVGDGEALAEIQKRYCQDAFINADGDSQIASFSSQSEAEEFANSLKSLTPYDFWVSTY